MVEHLLEKDPRSRPADAYEVLVTAQKWSWQFTYPNGYIDPDLHVPVDRDVVLTLESMDVIHSFYVPAFRIKKDAVPGRYTSLWFEATKVGEYDLFCAEYCGVAHADMITTVEAIPAAEFAAWLEDKPLAADAGKALLQKHGCLGCHSLDGTPMVGPTFQGIGGRQVVVVTNGETRTTSGYRNFRKIISRKHIDLPDFRQRGRRQQINGVQLLPGPDVGA